MVKMTSKCIYCKIKDKEIDDLNKYIISLKGQIRGMEIESYNCTC